MGGMEGMEALFGMSRAQFRLGMHATPARNPGAQPRHTTPSRSRSARGRVRAQSPAGLLDQNGRRIEAHTRAPENPLTTPDLTLDHVVILVGDLEQAIAGYSELGFTVQRGGSHADGATHNALVGFADGSYLELIAFIRPKPDHRWGGWAARGHRGFIDYALLPSSVGAVVDRARAAGLAYQGTFDGGRQRLDGELLRWQTGTPPTADLPFLCGDLTPRSLRVREGDVRRHANGASGIASISVLVADLPASLDRYQVLLGAAPVAPAVHVAAAGLWQAAFKLGPSWLVLVAAGIDSNHPQASAWRQALAASDGAVIGLTLHGGVAAALPRDKTQGAAIDIQTAARAVAPPSVPSR